MVLARWSRGPNVKAKWLLLFLFPACNFSHCDAPKYHYTCKFRDMVVFDEKIIPSEYRLSKDGNRDGLILKELAIEGQGICVDTCEVEK